jgi:hypothetical protein
MIGMSIQRRKRRFHQVPVRQAMSSLSVRVYPHYFEMNSIFLAGTSGVDGSALGFPMDQMGT